MGLLCSLDVAGDVRRALKVASPPPTEKKHPGSTPSQVLPTLGISKHDTVCIEFAWLTRPGPNVVLAALQPANVSMRFMPSDSHVEPSGAQSASTAVAGADGGGSGGGGGGDCGGGGLGSVCEHTSE